MGALSEIALTAAHPRPTDTAATGPADSSLGKLVWLDDDFIFKESLPDAFGDRFLYANNPIFRTVRKLTLSHGFRYSCEPGRFWLDYNNLSLLMLQEILDSGVIPYKDNLTTVRRFLDLNRSLDMPAGLLLNTLQHNYTLHESAHCIAYRLLSSRFGPFKASLDKQGYVVAAILCEAYANAVEHLGAASATDDVHRFFYTLNSFVECRAAAGALLTDAIRLFGLSGALTVAVLAFVYLNPHENPPSQEEIEAVITGAMGGERLGEAERAFLKVVIRHGFGLNKIFRTETTPVFFRFHGCEKEYEWLCAQQFNLQTLASLRVAEMVFELVNLTFEEQVIGVR
jgi:hypothetical protein